MLSDVFKHVCICVCDDFIGDACWLNADESVFTVLIPTALTWLKYVYLPSLHQIKSNLFAT